ncbi:hypothetical protein WMY93_021250 [Mugilogobius chulae]|uniref:Uncharacterized protein n=1 Tax=Mugilogobius chulae TaxID=88201 RepID=A0AAW0NBB5_9GOBI
MGPDWQVDVTSLVRSSIKVSDPEVARVFDGVILQGRAVGTSTVMVVSPVTSSVLGERTVRVVDDKVSVTELGVQLVSGLSLSLQLGPEGNRAVVATATAREVITQLKQEAVVTCWVHFSDGAVVPLDVFDRSIYSLSVTTPDERVATVRRTPRTRALVRVELRICEDCQKSKRKSKLVSGSGLLRINFQSNGISVDEDDRGIGTDGIKTSQRPVTDGDKSWFQSTVTDLSTATETTASTTLSTSLSTRSVSPHVVWIGNTGRDTTYAAATIATTASPVLNTPQSITKPTTTTVTVKEDVKSFGNMVEKSDLPAKKDLPKAEITPKKELPRSKTTSFIESDLIRTFRSYPIQAPPPGPGDPKDHKHDWVWLGSGNNHHHRNPPPPGTPAPPGTLKRERPLEPRHSVDSMNHHHNIENGIQTVSPPAFPERTATLGRCRSNSQQLQQGVLPVKPLDPMANRSATLLARPHRNEPLHSPTSKRNQVQFTTFTTLDIKHLAALKKNGVDLNWANQQQAVQAPPEPQTPLPDMPWPVVKPVGLPQ